MHIILDRVRAETDGMKYKFTKPILDYFFKQLVMTVFH